MASPERVQTVGDYAAMLRRRWPYLVTIFPAVLLAAVFMAFSLPAIYRSTATILLEPSSIPPELVKTTVVSYASQQIELVQRTVLTTDRLVPVVERTNPYPDQPGAPAKDLAWQIAQNVTLEKVDPITLEPLLESSAFSVHYTNPDPETAAAVARELANLFLEYNRETRVAAARQAMAFLQERADKFQKEIRAMDQRLAEFKRQYGDALPEAQGRNEASLDRTQRDVDALEAQIRIAAQQEALLKLQLSQISPTLVASGTDAYTQLGLLRSELAAAQQKYTPDHPDVKRLTRAIEALIASSKLQTTGPVRADNPDYLRVASELESVRNNLSALRATAARARSQTFDYERRLTLAPNVERDYVQLLRDREVAQVQYQEIRSKLGEAEIATSLESESKGERFTLIREPYASSKPFEPNRLGIILLGIVLGGALAVGVAALKESSDPTVRGSADLRSFGDLAIVGAIPVLMTPADRSRRNRVWGSVGIAYGIALVLVSIVVLTAT